MLEILSILSYYQDTSDRDIITPAVVALTIAAGGANDIGTAILGEGAAGTVKATALGNAVVTTKGSLVGEFRRCFTCCYHSLWYNL